MFAPLQTFVRYPEDLVLGSAAAASLGNAAARQVNEAIEKHSSGDAVDRDWERFQLSPAIGRGMIQFDLFEDTMFGFVVSFATEYIKAALYSYTINATANRWHGSFR